MSPRSLVWTMLAVGACATSAAPVAATTPAAASPAPAAKAGAARFHYDAAKGVCIDSDGKLGFNKADPATLFAGLDAKTRTYEGVNAECVDFSGLDFTKHIGLGYPNLLRWSFRGARFTGARFLFANMNEADFRGADLRQLEFGYAQISGTGDAHTQLPPPPSCRVNEGYAILCFK